VLSDHKAVVAEIGFSGVDETVAQHSVQQANRQ